MCMFKIWEEERGLQHLATSGGEAGPFGKHGCELIAYLNEVCWVTILGAYVLVLQGSRILNTDGGGVAQSSAWTITGRACGQGREARGSIHFVFRLPSKSTFCPPSLTFCPPATYLPRRCPARPRCPLGATTPRLGCWR